MKNQFHVIYERDEEWWIGYCPEIPGANGQGKTKKECQESLANAIKLILHDRLKDTLKAIPPGAIKETISI
ncbi:MAG: type II toxin-antitoxin system HicB family antitoxin [Spirochaetes bacterium]|nr:type II toxin-antitoxin system HicB family antitoxin [Spirochaetota bacterium]